MITLYQFRPVWGLPNPSPYCFKVENYLRMTDLPFTTKVGDPRKAPKKKLPYIDDGGTIVADSAHIIEHLKKTRGDKLDADLTADQRAMGHILTRFIEEAYYWCGVYSRWLDNDGFQVAEQEILAPSLPPLLRPILTRVIRKQIGKALYAQGTGRHTQDEIYAKGTADLDALSSSLGQKPFFLGDAPTTVDATAYAFLAPTLLAPPAGGVLRQHVTKLKNLVDYCDRMKARYYAGSGSP